MKNQPVMLVRADEGPGIGAGHVMRCLALARAWGLAGGRSVFLGAVPGVSVAEAVRAAYARVEAPGVEPYGQADALRTVELLRGLAAESGSAPWCVTDGYGFGTDWQRTVRGAGFPLLVVDDRAHLDSYEADIVLNHNPDAADLNYTLRPGCRALFGVRYSLLRPEFGAARALRAETRAQCRRVLVTMGGADAKNVCTTVVRALVHAGQPGLEAVVVAGPSNPHMDALRGVAAGSPLAVEVVPSTDDMAGLMAEADLAVSAAGGTCWELCHMGVPVVMVVTADNQVGVAAGVRAAGAGVLAGAAEDVEPEALGRLVGDLARDAGRRSAMAENGRRLVDGQGPDRVVAAMRGVPIRLRRACPDDSDILLAWRNEPAVRAVSFRSGPVPREEHERWFRRCLADGGCYFYVAVETADGERPAGQIRFDVRDGRAMVSVALGEGFRGRGLGTALIREGTSRFVRESGVARVRAEIREGNKASARAFAKAGYRPAGDVVVKGKASLAMDFDAGGEQ